MSLRSALGRVRGLGSAKEGVEHWWGQRLSALALIPLVLWFTGSVAMMTGAGYEAVVAWAGSPVVAGLLILLIVLFWTGCDSNEPLEVESAQPRICADSLFTITDRGLMIYDYIVGDSLDAVADSADVLRDFGSSDA